MTRETVERQDRGAIPSLVSMKINGDDLVHAMAAPIAFICVLLLLLLLAWVDKKDQETCRQGSCAQGFQPLYTKTGCYCARLMSAD